MGKRIAAVDAYIRNAADFARPILEHFRDLVHRACPQVEETWKWHKKEYVEWITEAKREQTRATRLATALQWLAQGKSRHWQYQ